VNQDPDEVLKHYERRCEQTSAGAAAASGEVQQCMIGLIALAIVTCYLLYASFKQQIMPAWSPLAPILAAVYLGRLTGERKQRTAELYRLLEYYQHGVARLRLDWDQLPDTGEEFRDPHHFYCEDLDLFGRGSLFQLMGTCRSGVGRDTLAGWMLHPATREEAMARQQAVDELRGQQKLREKLALAGASTTAQCRTETFREWLDAPPAELPEWLSRLAGGMACVSVALPLSLWLGLWGKVDWVQWLTAWFGLQLLVAGSFRDKVRAVLEAIKLPSLELEVMGDLLHQLEPQPFTSPKLRAIQEALITGPRPAVAQVTWLRRWMGWLKWRDNEVLTYATYALLWGTQFACLLERWRLRHAADLRGWLQAIGEMEALAAMSGYAFEHAADPFPELLDGPACLRAEGLGHPLLKTTECVRNDIALGGDRRFVVVSGSNMSGKSTFLRSIGTNVVLAWMGAPVRCDRFAVSNLLVGASIRVQDSLVEGKSRFFAEVDRLRNMIEAAGGEVPLLFLVDEIMSGTNSSDRKVATRSILAALVERGAIGLISTHDLALTEIALQLPGGANVHFADSADGGSLDFDYRLRPGVVQHSNALAIVRMLGIPV